MIVYGAIGAAVLVSIAFLLVYRTEEVDRNETSITNGSAQTLKLSPYDEANKLLKQSLAEHDISMSSPIKIQSQESIQKYCSFFTNEEIQKLVQYCTSTEIKDSEGKFLGNIHMVGSPNEPKITLVILQVDPFMSQIDSVKTIIESSVQNLVCDCWADVQPGNLKDVGELVEGLKQFHLQGSRPHSQSNELELNGKTLQLELTTNKDGYLWQFFIYG